MMPVVILGVTVGLASFYGAAYLLSLWHEDARSGTTGWPLSRVLAYLAIAGTLASNTLAALTLLRLLDVPNFIEIRDALQPLTFAALVTLDVLFTVLALYLRVVRSTGYITPSERSLLATEASVQMAIAAAREAYTEANHSNNKLAETNRHLAVLTEIVGHKEDKI